MSSKSLSFAVALLLSMSLVLTGCNSPAFEKTDCLFSVPAGLEIECGSLAVPENRANRNSRMIHLQVAIVKPASPHPLPDPVVVLNGGPGNGTLAGIDFWLYVFRPILHDRALILLDGRGVGYSQPSLNCPEVENVWQRNWSQNLSLQVSDQNYVRSLKACHDRLTAEGIDLSGYTTAENVADVRDLRMALGYPKWNLYGGDYGSRLALEVMRQDPAGVRSVILDSAYPPQVDLYGNQADQLERSLTLLFKHCETNADCNRSYPDLPKKFYGLVDGLDAQPGIYRIYDPSASKFHDLYLNGDRWIWAVSQMFYGTGLTAKLPKRVSTVQGDMFFSFGGDLNRLISREASLSEGVYYSIQCAEELPSLTPAASKSANLEFSPRLPGVMSASQMIHDCSAWPEDQPASLSRWAVTSDIPTLILAGELDPITPPAWGKLTAATLSRSQLLTFPGFGHGVLGGGPDGGECTIQIMSDFLDHPTAVVDSSCIQSLDMGFLSP